MSGVVSLMLEANADLGWRDVQNILANSAALTGSPITSPATGHEDGAWFSTTAGNWNGGGHSFHLDYGYGMVNAYNAVRMSEVWDVMHETAQTSANEQHVSVDTGALNLGIVDEAFTTISTRVETDIEIETVMVTVHLTHSFASDLELWLVAPDDTSRFMLMQNEGGDTLFDTGFEWQFEVAGARGFSSLGHWTLEMRDEAAGDVGVLHNFQLDFYGSTTSANDVHTFTDDYVTMAVAEAGRAAITDTNGGVDWLNMAAVSGSINLDLGGGIFTVGVINWGDLAADQFENVITGDGDDTITGNAPANTIMGMRGNDAIYGLGGDDELTGGLGRDSVYGGTQNDIFHLEESDDASGEIYNGSSDFDAVYLHGVNSFSAFNFDASDFISVESIVFENDLGGGGYATFLAAQMSTVEQVRALAHTGQTNRLEVAMGAETAVDLSVIIYSGFSEPGDGNTITGDADTELMIGSSITDTIFSGGGNDTLEGGGGADNMVGSAGNDTFRYSNGQGSTADENANGGAGGSDRIQVRGGGTFDLRTLYATGIDEVEFESSTGNTASVVRLTTDQLLGNAGFANALLVDGNLGTGNDDTLQIDVETVVDVDMSGFTFQTWDNDLYDDVDLIVVNGSIGSNLFLGSSANDVMFGLSENDQLEGNEGDDTLDGGTGADVMIGGLGSDLYRVDNVADIVTETAGEGEMDVLETSVSYTLATDQEIELLRTIDPSGSTGLSLTGNSGAQRIEGNMGPNTLRGGGGADTLAGGIGNDAYIIGSEDSAVVIEEFAGEGTADRVNASVNYVLAAGIMVEQLHTDDSAGRTAINLTGNEHTLLIYGNEGDNRLEDGGSDFSILTGYGGNDQYVVNNSTTMIAEYADGGTRDEVSTTVDFALEAGSDIEVLAAEVTASTTPLLLTGNALAQEILGNDGANTLNDGAGAGADTLWGFGGDDRYIIGNAGTTVFENADEGTDTVESMVSHTLGDNVENLTLTGPDDVDGTGNDLENTILGNSGANVISGGGGEDTQAGGESTDTFGISSEQFTGTAGDRIRDFQFGIDRLDLSEFSAVELLQLGSELVTGGVNLLWTVTTDIYNIGFVTFADASLASVGTVTITGTTTQGESLSAVLPALVNPDDLGTLSYSWMRDGSLITGANTANYMLMQDDVGAAISARIEYVGGLFEGIYLTSTATSTVANTNDAPTGAVAITGTLTQGATLTADISTVVDADGIDTSTIAYQWLRNGTAITGATGATLVLGQDDVGTTISVRMSYTDGFGASESVSSGSTEPIVGGLNLVGTPDTDRLEGSAFNDTISGLDGADTLIGGDGDDNITGGATSEDLRDIIYGGNGNDTIDGGYGNDELRGDAGNDHLAGGFGVDTVIGGAGDDVMTGSAYSDLIFGGDGLDFVNGGFGHDRVNGGGDGDRFYHLGIADHGSDWIQDYNAADGDVLLWGGAAATTADFQINTADTAEAGVDGVSESFIIYRPTAQIMWALVDGDAQRQINIQIAGQVFDLLE